MTEETFQECRKIMQSANFLRGRITEAKGEVAKWTNIEDANRRNFQPEKADGAKKILLRYIEKLEEFRRRFKELKFPENI